MGVLSGGGADVRIGLSGWTYPHWRKAFYPAGLAQRRELEFASRAFSTLEINGSFYSLQRPSSYRAWRDATPGDFLFAVKGGRFITHQKKLANVDQPLATFFASGLLDLGERLGPILWQLPPGLAYHPERMAAFFARLPMTTDDAARLAAGYEPRLFERWSQEPVVRAAVPGAIQHAVEVRHPSFATGEFAAQCRESGIALVVADTAGRFPWVDEVTADLVYVRLHGDAELYLSQYSDQGLDRWADRIRGWARTPGVRRVCVYFDNDGYAHAPQDAARLVQRLG
ncbi:DUF72 domain-containing protein [Nakamurella flavida]|uniref:DUF72 domain-containing protein n=1 Tax=Nakamurella flavida TaxID=363630 RepID=A0A939C114_9ACTN|nr:DUF72 domain-containing protein [Nakamurella flavida]MBM9477268.1 DUF72 domain-containing protein [Nakamurella flavida]MDP9779724.1 uncharacterized protein YecE (DUF72 family) [Nakamurella flavida]